MLGKSSAIITANNNGVKVLLLHGHTYGLSAALRSVIDAIEQNTLQVHFK